MPADGKKLYLRLLRYVAPYRRAFVFAIAALVVLAATEPALPALLKPTLDDGFAQKDLDTVAFMSVMVVVVFFIRGLASYASAFSMAWVAGKVVMDLRNRMFEKLMLLPSSYYDTNPSGQIISKLTFDANQVTEAASYVLTVLVRDTLAIVGLLGWMFYLDWRLTLVTFATAPIVVFIVRHFSTRLRNMSHHLQRSMGEVTQTLTEVIEGEKVVRVFAGQDYEQTRFQRAANLVRRYQLKFASSAAAVAPFAQLVTSVAAAIILYMAASRAVESGFTPGAFASFFTAMALLFSPIKRLTGVNGRLQKGLAGAESVFNLLDTATEPDEGLVTLDGAEGCIELRNVTFTYETGRVRAIEDVSLTIQPGEMVALVGSSGAGKTTVANLIPRFYRPSAGQILIDGLDTANITLLSLRKHISLVSQDVVLFDDTVAANVAYGARGEASEEDILKAVRSANALSFIEELPQGLATVIGQNGVRLSGGQRQRIAIARAFIKDAPILILDEATSSLDTISEQEIQNAVERLRAGRTTLVIAHKLSTIEKADRIIVMNEGTIAGEGTHARLLDENNLYGALYRFQFSSPGGNSREADDDDNREGRPLSSPNE